VATISMAAPMRSSTSTNAMRAGLSVTSSITSSEPGVMVAATTQNAADEDRRARGVERAGCAKVTRRALVDPGDRRAESDEHARCGRGWARLGDLGGAAGLQAGEDQRGLTRAGRELMPGAGQSPPRTTNGGAYVGAAVDVRSSPAAVR
jgi:hypothetical protein